MPELLPGKLFQAAIYPTIFSGKESKVPAKLELKSTCGCPVDEPTLAQTEMSGMPTEVSLAQVCFRFIKVCVWDFYQHGLNSPEERFT